MDIYGESKDPLFVAFKMDPPASLLLTENLTCKQKETDSGYKGIDVNAPYLSRDILLNKLKRFAEGSQFILLTSPPGYGKTALLRLFAQSYNANCYYVSCHGRSLRKVMRRLRIDTLYGTTELENERRIIMIDNAQKVYGKRHRNDWLSLIKAVCQRLRNTTFMISATHLLSYGTIGMESLPRLETFDFLLSYSQSLDLLKHEQIGLNGVFHRCDSLCQVIVNECAGLIAALRLAIDNLNKYYLTLEKEFTEQEALSYYFSTVIEKMKRCFSHHELSEEVIPSLMECLTTPVSLASLDKKSEEFKKYFNHLVKRGILRCDNAMFVYSSQLAKRYFASQFYTNRSETDPTTLKELVINSIKSISASALKQAQAQEPRRKEALLKHLMYQVLLENTSPACTVFPELYKSFGVSKIEGSLDFYIGNHQQWGIELLVSAERVQEMDNFKDKYEQLKFQDHLVIDFRLSETRVNSLDKHPNRITIVCNYQDYSYCHCT